MKRTLKDILDAQKLDGSLTPKPETPPKNWRIERAVTLSTYETLGTFTASGSSAVYREAVKHFGRNIQMEPQKTADGSIIGYAINMLGTCPPNSALLGFAWLN